LILCCLYRNRQTPQSPETARVLTSPITLSMRRAQLYVCSSQVKFLSTIDPKLKFATPCPQAVRRKPYRRGASQKMALSKSFSGRETLCIPARRQSDDRRSSADADAPNGLIFLPFAREPGDSKTNNIPSKAGICSEDSARNATRCAFANSQYKKSAGNRAASGASQVDNDRRRGPLVDG
jgi:hypothetical protein